MWPDKEDQDSSSTPEADDNAKLPGEVLDAEAVDWAWSGESIAEGSATTMPQVFGESTKALKIAAAQVRIC